MKILPGRILSQKFTIYVLKFDIYKKRGAYVPENQ
jgi:hypothetical protein